ncbi:uncharacterized protein LOC133725742 [Rosa rugosa]|uniref:uncharacterized protein LOC133725742 n=1 Tax=Rosa rugosa TaxID=74645 RepID=UPI002B41731A|nr:uncharacterized protein LOC133725742 [Rosa rugosa]
MEVEDCDFNMGSWILMRFTNPTRKEHLEIRQITVAMAHDFIAQKVAPSAVAYLEATCLSLSQLPSSSEPHVIEALFTILSVVIPQVSPEILNSRSKLVSEAVVRLLRIQPSSLNNNAGALGLKCISQLLAAIILNNNSNSNSTWSDVSYLYDYLLDFTTSSILRVRKPSSHVIGELLQSFQGTPHLAPASEALTSLFERWWLPVLSGGGASNTAAAAALTRRGVPEYWYLLDVMKICLVFMPTKFKLAVLNYFKAIFELILELEAHRPPVTVRLGWCLHRVCLHPSTDVPPQLLLDLLCLVSKSVSRKVPHAHEGYTTSSLLNTGVAKVYSSNRGICVSKLPLVFHALKILMGKPVQEDDGNIEEDIDAAANAFKCVIHACVDQGLIKQGVDQIGAIANKYEPQPQESTIIEKLCATIHSLLGYHQTNAPALSMDLAFEVVSTMFDKLGAYASYFMRGTLERLADMHKLPDEEFPFRKQATLLLGSLVEEKCGLHDDINIRAVLPQEQLMALLADYRGLKSQKKSELSHRKRKMGLNIGSPPGSLPYDCSPEMMAEAAKAAVSGAAQIAKKIKL